SLGCWSNRCLLVGLAGCHLSASYVCSRYFATRQSAISQNFRGERAGHTKRNKSWLLGRDGRGRWMAETGRWTLETLDTLPALGFLKPEPAGWSKEALPPGLFPISPHFSVRRCHRPVRTMSRFFSSPNYTRSECPPM
ncbi:unnamed protein product, partial [Ectocarpus sp. 4 AP-2014]